MALRRIDKTFSPPTKDINYLNKSFADYRQSLIDFAKVYFPDTYTDFNEASPGMMFIEMAAYVGDVLGYYIDSSFRENLIQYASERNNIISIAQSLGYQPKPVTAATCQIYVYQLVPAGSISTNYAPNENYCLRLATGMEVAATEFGVVNFRTIDEVNFADPVNREITVYSVDGSNRPTFYLYRKKIKVVAGTIKEYTATFTSPEKFSKVILPDTNVIEVVSVTDQNENKWYQVDYLAQDLILENELNSDDTYASTFATPPAYIMRVTRTPRRFVLRYNDNFQAELQFGSGMLDSSDVLVNLDPKKIGSSEYEFSLASTSLDPSDFLSSESYGLAPNGSLTIKYTVGGGLESNVPSNTITTINSVKVLNDVNASTIDLSVFNTVVRSLAVTNFEAATGGKDEDTIEEIRQNALAFFNSQNRLVTIEDYIVRAYAMPPKYGGIAKAFVTQDEQINNILRATLEQQPVNGIYVDDTPGAGIINMYVLGYNRDKRLVPLNSTTKQNLKTYLDQYRMLTDQVRIFDAYVVNIGVEFNIMVFKGYNMNEVIARCIDTVNQFFVIDKWQINQPIVLNDLYVELAAVEGVQSILDLTVFNRYKSKDGADYNDYIYDIPAATQNGVIYPSLDPCIFEIRYPDRDIIGNAIQ